MCGDLGFSVGAGRRDEDWIRGMTSFNLFLERLTAVDVLEHFGDRTVVEARSQVRLFHESR